MQIKRENIWNIAQFYLVPRSLSRDQSWATTFKREVQKMTASAAVVKLAGNLTTLATHYTMLKGFSLVTEQDRLIDCYQKKLCFPEASEIIFLEENLDVLCYRNVL